MVEIKIRADVSPSIHPHILATEVPTLSIPGTIGSESLSSAQAALATMYNCAAQVFDAEKAISEAPATGDRVMVMGRIRPVSDASEGFGAAVDKSVSAAAKSVDGQMKRLLGFEEGLATKVKNAVWDSDSERVSGVAVAGEVRGHFKKLPVGKRLSEAMAAIRAGDRRTTTALLSAPSYLSGLSEENLAIIRDLAGERFAPTEFAQLRATRSAIEKVQAAGGYFLNDTNRSKGRTVERTATRSKARRAIAELATV